MDRTCSITQSNDDHIKEENPFHLQLFGKFVLFANPGIRSSIHVPQSIPASSLMQKSCGKTSNGLKREFVDQVVESQGVTDVTVGWTRGTGDTGIWPCHG